MKLCQAAALALVGWYLMVPGDDIKNPLSKWHVFRSFDTAEKCQIYIEAGRHTPERWMQEHKQELERKFKTLTRKEWEEEIKKEATAELEREYEFNAAQCIASDDPRLKGN